MPVYQRKDSFHQRAKREGFRSRAAYKLAEIQASHRLLRPGQRVADLGCWPGGWLQVAAAAVGEKGRVVGVDIAVLEPGIENENVIALSADLLDPGTAPAVRAALGGRADVVLCDAAPKLTGVRATDRAREEALLEGVATLLPDLLVRGGALVLKILACPEAEAIERRLRAHFDAARTARPRATRKGSAERYLIARGYSGA